MLKIVLLATALISWPIAANASAADINCVPITSEFNDHLVKDFDVENMFITPVDNTKGEWIKNTIFIAKTPAKDGSKEVVVVSTAFKDEIVVGQCVIGYGYNTDELLKNEKEAWEAYKASGGKATPLPSSPEGHSDGNSDAVPSAPPNGAPSPKFQYKNESDD